MKLITTLIVTLAAAFASSARAAVTEYTNKNQWIAAVDSFTTIDFTGYPQNTIITDHYASQGAHFTDGIDVIFLNQGFVNDGAGLYGAYDEITVEFSTPQYWIGAEFPGRAQFFLLFQGKVIFESTEFGGSGIDWFGGITSDQPFDKAMIIDPAGGLFIDDLFFGGPVPAPGALALLGLAALAGRSRQRSIRGS